MPLCRYSSELTDNGFMVIDNNFINEFLPQATGDDVKVYLFGLKLCASFQEEDNSLDTISKVLSMTKDKVKSSFLYWQEMGLVQIVSQEPFEVKFLPIKSHSGSVKIRNKEKYADFNKHIQDVISGRMISTNEFNEYYVLMEVYHIEPMALVAIARYCVEYKNNAVGYPYILAVARSFANDGIKTYDSVEEKFKQNELSRGETKMVLSAMGIKRDADIEERNLYNKWTSKFGFTHGVIVQVAKTVKKGGFYKLDEVLTKYFEQKLLTSEDIENFSKEREGLFETAKVVAKNLGLYYQNLENVVETYITNWHNKGFDNETLIFLSQNCFEQSIRTLEGMNTIVQKFYKLAIISIDSIKQYMEGAIKTDERIKSITEALGLFRNVSSLDRELYRNWTENWNFSDEQIKIVATSLQNRAVSMQYLGRVLAEMHSSEIKTDDEIKKFVSKFSSGNSSDKSKVSGNKFETRNYTKEELSAVFDSLDDVEI